MVIGTHAFCCNFRLMIFSKSSAIFICCHHTQPWPFSRINPDIPPLVLTRTNGPASKLQFLQQSDRPQWCQRSQQGFKSWPWVWDAYPHPRHKFKAATDLPQTFSAGEPFLCLSLVFTSSTILFSFVKVMLGILKNLPDLFFSFPHKIWKNFKKWKKKNSNILIVWREHHPSHQFDESPSNPCSIHLLSWSYYDHVVHPNCA